MSSQHPEGYANLPEDESFSSKQQVQGNQIEFAQGSPVIVQGTREVAMSYPAPMGNFESNPVPSQLYKLKTGPYVCYKYWVLAVIAIEVLYPIKTAIWGGAKPPDLLIFKLFAWIISIWNVIQLSQIYIAIRDKSLEKINRGLYLMGIYMCMLALFTLTISFDPSFEPPKAYRGNMVALTVNAILSVGIILCGFFVLFMYPAMRVREILETTSQGSDKAHSRSFNNA